MDILVQFVYILFNLFIIYVVFEMIGEKPKTSSKYKAAGQAAFIHGVFTLAFVIWWDTPDMVSLIAKIAAIALMWLPWIYDLADIHKPAERVTLKSAMIGALLQASRIGLVLGFWTLY